VAAYLCINFTTTTNYLNLFERMKMLSKEIVKIVAENHLLEFGKTTSLDVKNDLRNKGFYAVQSDVSSYLDTIAYEESWRYVDNGKFRVYHLDADMDRLLSKFLMNLPDSEGERCSDR